MAFERSQLLERLHSVTPLVEQICKTSGTPGASIVVAQRGRQIFQHHYGYRDVERREAPDSDTVYYVGSLSKGIAAAAVGILVDEKRFDWNTTLSQLIPTFQQRDKSLEDMINVADILSHRTGLSGPNALWSQGGNKVYLERESIIPTFANLQTVKDFRASWLYCNPGYWLADEIISRTTGQTYGSFLIDRIFSPLGMTRTFIKKPDSTPPNSAKAYMPMEDGTFAEIPPPAVFDGSAIATAGGVKSSATDMLKYYSALLRSRELEFFGNEDKEATTIKQASYLTSARTLLSPRLMLEQSYGLGLARVQLPGSFGAIGLNPGLLEEMPTIGKGAASKLVIYHQGSFPGFLSAVFMIPDEDVVLLVLTNSLAFNDAADWLGQMVLEYIIDSPQKTDFVKLAEETRNTTLRMYRTFEDHLKHDGTPDPKTKPLGAYAGSYYNSPNTFAIKVVEKNEQLHMYFQNETWDVYTLKPCGNDCFSWGITYKEQVERARWPIANVDYYKFQFEADDHGVVSRLEWHHDPNTGPETFVKERDEHASTAHS